MRTMAMPSLEDVAQEAAAGDEIKRYLAVRGIKTTATLALLATNLEQLDRVLVKPLMDGWPVEGSTPITLTPSEQPIATAILHHISPHVVGVQVFVGEDAGSSNNSLISDGYTAFITCQWVGSTCSRREGSEAAPTWSMEQAPSQLWTATDRWPQQDFSCARSPGGRISAGPAPLGTWDLEVVYTGEDRWALGAPHLPPIGRNQPAIQEGTFWQHLGDLRQQAGPAGRDKLATQERARHPWWVGFHQVGLHLGGPRGRGGCHGLLWLVGALGQVTATEDGSDGAILDLYLMEAGYGDEDRETLQGVHRSDHARLWQLCGMHEPWTGLHKEGSQESQQRDGVWWQGWRQEGPQQLEVQPLWTAS